MMGECMMIDKISGFIRENNMLSEGDTVVCGLSGGADSVCLLLSLCELSESLGITVEALHVNHCMRGEESDRDEQFCRELCDRLGVHYMSFSCNIVVNRSSMSVEEAARKLRYEIFRDNSQGKKLATAHNANDNLETMILNLARGTGIKGLAGIPAVRDNIIRPLLTVTRDEIEGFLAAKGQSYVTDSTNLSDDYTRNKIRHRIIPLLREINSSVVQTSISSSNTLREENALIESLTDEAYKKALDGSILRDIAELDPVIRKRCIARLLTENGLPYSRDRLEAADDIARSGGKLNVSRDIFLVGINGSLSLERLISQPTVPREKELVIGKNRIFRRKTLICELVKCDNLKKIEAVHKNLTFYLLDYDKIIGRAVVRDRRFGDRIRLSGRDFTSSVKKLINEKIPAHERPYLHFIEDEEGTVFAEQLGIAERVAPDENTARILKISVKDWRG